MSTATLTIESSTDQSSTDSAGARPFALGLFIDRPDLAAGFGGVHTGSGRFDADRQISVDGDGAPLAGRVFGITSIDGGGPGEGDDRLRLALGARW